MKSTSKQNSKPHSPCQATSLPDSFPTQAKSFGKPPPASHISLDAALYHLRQGRSVVPIKPSNKVPFVKWKRFQGELAGEELVVEWWHRWPDAMPGIITGNLSGIVGLDVDGARGMASLKDKDIPITWTVESPRHGGVHYWYAYPRNEDIPSRNGFLPGVDLRAEGGIIIAPGSVRSDGSTYRFKELLGPEHVELASCPNWIIELSRNRRRKPTTAEKNQQQQETGGASNEYSLLASLPSSLGVVLDYVPAAAAARIKQSAGKAQEELSSLDFVAAAARILGIPEKAVKNLGSPFCCVLPGHEHEEEHPSASLFRRADGKVVYHDWHAASGEQWYGLADVYASQHYGRAVKLNPPELATWTLRLGVEIGAIAPVKVDMPPLPDGTRALVRRLYEGFRLLLGCKWLYKPGEPTAFSWRFAAAWCGVSARHVGQLMRELLAGGYIRQGGELAVRGGRLALFAPGTEPVMGLGSFVYVGLVSIRLRCVSEYCMVEARNTAGMPPSA